MFTIILLMGAYVCMDFKEKHIGEKHTLDEWEKLIEESDEYNSGELAYSVKTFDTSAEMEVYNKCITDVENYLSSDFYTFATILV